MASAKSLKVNLERHRKLKIISANTGLTVSEAMERFGGPGIDAEYEREVKESQQVTEKNTCSKKAEK